MCVCVCVWWREGAEGVLYSFQGNILTCSIFHDLHSNLTGSVNVMKHLVLE